MIFFLDLQTKRMFHFKNQNKIKQNKTTIVNIYIEINSLQKQNKINSDF